MYSQLQLGMGRVGRFILELSYVRMLLKKGSLKLNLCTFLEIGSYAPDDIGWEGYYFFFCGKDSLHFCHLLITFNRISL